MSWHFLQEQGAASWEANCLDGAPSALLKLMPTRAVCFSLANVTACCLDFPSGTMCEPSMAAAGEAVSTWLRADSRVPTSALRDEATASKERPQDSGRKWPASWAKYDLDSSLWRTHQRSLLEAWAPYLETWPQWGLMRDGEFWGLTTPTLPTSDRGSGFWPTITASIGRKCGGRHRGKADTLASRLAEVEGLSTSSTGRVNPVWGEWLMGWPEGWTDYKPLETAKYREWLQQHGAS